MKKILSAKPILGLLLLSMSNLAIGAIPNTDDPTTFLGPTLKTEYANIITDNTAYAVLGELGWQNLRANGTLGWQINNANRIKLSAEFLRQKIEYGFFSGSSTEWINQSAIGANYQYDVGRFKNMVLELGAYASHAPNKRLSNVIGQYTNSDGNIVAFNDQRRIAGSAASGVSPGIRFKPWRCAAVGMLLNYDSVTYDTTSPYDQDAKGLGGTVQFNQTLQDNLALDLSLAMRQPFNSYQMGLTWTNVPYLGAWAIAVDGVYTDGKNTLPNTYNIGISLNYLAEPKTSNRMNVYSAQQIAATKKMTHWAIKPAVYLPQVLAIVDNIP